MLCRGSEEGVAEDILSLGKGFFRGWNAPYGAWDGPGAEMMCRREVSPCGDDGAVGADSGANLNRCLSVAGGSQSLFFVRDWIDIPNP